MNPIPRWLEELLIKAVRDFLPPSVIKEAFLSWKNELMTKLKAMAADTSNKIDDKLVDMVDQALSTCTPDSQFICDLIQNGEAALIAKLRVLAASTDTELDDAAVDILEDAMK